MESQLFANQLLGSERQVAGCGGEGWSPGAGCPGRPWVISAHVNGATPPDPVQIHLEVGLLIVASPTSPSPLRVFGFGFLLIAFPGHLPAIQSRNMGTSSCFLNCPRMSPA